MSIAKQTGVALVQVLLISALLLLLVVRLSQDAQSSVEIATKLKNKVNFIVNSETGFAEIQYAALTQEKGFTLRLQEGQKVNFHSDPVKYTQSMMVEIQDLAGHLSTTFFGNQWLDFVQGDNEKLDSLKEWQGLEGYGVSAKKNRNARIPYKKELFLLGGWENKALDLVTHYPTGFFNVATAPNQLLQLILPVESVEKIEELRRTNTMSRQNMMRIPNIDSESVFPPSKYIQVTLKNVSNNELETHLQRIRTFNIQTGERIPVLEIGNGT
ncbi:MAG: hypothetical protein GJ680_19675 [Alteromonadaceae bacterium]|nr:hypothetical protein [Alteromonadaceae bacterium]